MAKGTIKIVCALAIDTHMTNNITRTYAIELIQMNYYVRMHTHTNIKTNTILHTSRKRAVSILSMTITHQSVHKVID